jgi:hypothetical protein
VVTPEQAEVDDAKRPRVEEGLSAPLMLLLMLAVVAMVVGIWRFAPRLGRGD